MKSYIDEADWDLLDLESLEALLYKVMARDLPDDDLYVGELQRYIEILTKEEWGE